MRLAAVFIGLLAVAVSSAQAGPLQRVQARDEAVMNARDLNLVVRDVLRAVHARELADLDARAIGISTSLLKRAPKEPVSEPPPQEPPAASNPESPSRGNVVEPQLNPDQQARIYAHNEEIRNRPAVPPGPTPPR
ncbi:hypothetical protein EIP91_002105 [Steccherinum ochraceum]|uniref:Uncharacterized protein n=1 Tax=Steccherinum ochraceum TaxID=92696 RepID=A0A4R0RXH3_9APHY|nr:hypothetical protein EIP91_002105 [Steccherinum ochraceum]